VVTTEELAAAMGTRTALSGRSSWWAAWWSGCCRCLCSRWPSRQWECSSGRLGYSANSAARTAGSITRYPRISLLGAA